ncbi:MULTISPECIES: hypothetical protein [Methanosarcina]|nr:MULTISPECIES: hypothetical protein [Methanosarcina]
MHKSVADLNRDISAKALEQKEAVSMINSAIIKLQSESKEKAAQINAGASQIQSAVAEIKKGVDEEIKLFEQKSSWMKDQVCNLESDISGLQNEIDLYTKEFYG